MMNLKEPKLFDNTEDTRRDRVIGAIRDFHQTQRPVKRQFGKKRNNPAKQGRIS